jgi:general secretion pathway protein K
MKRQQGVALILALLLVSLATVAAVALTSDQQFLMRKGGNLLGRDQALQYALGAEAWGRLWLTRDLKANKIDHNQECWAMEIPPLPVEGGVVVARLFDLQGRFNINNLLDPSNPGKINPATLNQLQNLLAAVDVPVTTAEAAADWLDEDFNPTGTGGAEDGYYMGLENPYRSANRPMQSVSEFRLLREMTAEMMTQLSGANTEPDDPRLLVSALPGTTNININTAPLEVIQALGVPKSAAEAIIQDRDLGSPVSAAASGTPSLDCLTKPPGVYDDVQDFLSIPAVQQANIQADGLSVSSQYFLLTTQASIARSRAVLYSIIFRDATNGNTQVISRSYGTL